MSINTSAHVVCRLLGGSGRAPLTAVPTCKLPALLVPIRRPTVDLVAVPPFPLALAA